MGNYPWRWINHKLANGMKIWKGTGNTATLLLSLKEPQILHQERRGQIKIMVMEHFNGILFHKSFPSFSLPVLCEQFEAMTGFTAPSSDGLLAEDFRGFLSCKVNSRRSVYNPRYLVTITLWLFVRCDWHGTGGKWPLARNKNRSWWLRHTSLKPF